MFWESPNKRRSKKGAEAPPPTEGTEEQETISAAAIRYEDELYTGTNHGQALDQLMEARPRFKEKDIEEGFVTSTGRFVNRREADQIAFNAGQKKSGEYKGRLESPDVTFH